MKYNVNGRMMTEAEMHASQTPTQVYADCVQRMGTMRCPAERERLHRRWPTLADCNRDMVAAFAALSADERAEDAREVEDNLRFIICPPEPKPAEPEPETPVVPAPEARPLPPGVKSCTFDELLSALEAHRQGRVRAAETAEEEA